MPSAHSELWFCAPSECEPAATTVVIGPLSSVAGSAIPSPPSEAITVDLGDAAVTVVCPERGGAASETATVVRAERDDAASETATVVRAERGDAASEAETVDLPLRAPPAPLVTMGSPPAALEVTRAVVTAEPVLRSAPRAADPSSSDAVTLEADSTHSEREEPRAATSPASMPSQTLVLTGKVEPLSLGEPSPAAPLPRPRTAWCVSTAPTQTDVAQNAPRWRGMGSPAQQHPERGQPARLERPAAARAPQRPLARPRPSLQPAPPRTSARPPPLPITARPSLRFRWFRHQPNWHVLSAVMLGFGLLLVAYALVLTVIG